MPDFNRDLSSNIVPESTPNLITPVSPESQAVTPFQTSVGRLGEQSALNGNDLLASLSQNSNFSGQDERVTDKELNDNKRYGIYNPTITNQEGYKALNQSGWDRVGNAGVQFVNKFGSYLAQTAGFIGGVPFALAGGAVNMYDKVTGGDGKVIAGGNAISEMTDNFLVNLADAWKEKVQEANPIYKSDKYTQGNIWQKLGTTSWWLDDFVDRAALTASCVVPGVLEAKGLGLFGTVAREAGALEATGMGAKAMKIIADNPEMYGKLGKILSDAVYKEATTGAVNLVGPAATNFKNIVRLGQYAELVSFNTIGQNTLNARESQVAIRRGLKEQREQGLINMTDAEIDDKAATGAMKGFWYNMPLTLLSSAFELPQLFSSMKGAQNFLSKSLGTMRTEGVMAGLEAAKKEVLKPSLLKVLGTSLLTGLEHGQLESSQVAIGRAIEEAMVGKVVDGKIERDDSQQRFWNSDALMDSFKDYIGNFHDANGQNNIALGTIQGLLTTWGGHAMKSFKGTKEKSEYAQQQESKNKFIDSLIEAEAGRRTFNGLSDMLAKDDKGNIVFEGGKAKFDQNKLTQLGLSNADAILKHEKLLQIINEGDQTSLDYYNHQSLAQLAAPFFQDASGMEYLQNILKFQHKVTKEAGTFETDIINGKEVTPDIKLDNALRYVEQLKQAHNNIEQRHAGFLNLDVNYKDKEESSSAAMFTEMHKHLQFTNAAEQLFFKNKLEANQAELASLSVDKSKLWVEAPVADVSAGKQSEKFEKPSSTEESRYNDIVDENKHIQKYYEDSKETYRKSIDRDEINGAWMSLKKVHEDARKKAEDIKIEAAKTPEQKAEEATAKPTTVKIKTSKGEQDYEIGTEYSVLSATKSKEGPKFFEFKSFKVLGKNEDGTLKLDTDKGIMDVSPDIFNNGNPIKTEDVNKNTKAKYVNDNINKVGFFNFGKNKGGEKAGRLSYDEATDTILFHYLDDKNIHRVIPIEGKHVSAKYAKTKGFDKTQFNFGRELTKAEEAQMEELENSKFEIKNSILLLQNSMEEMSKDLAEVNTKITSKQDELTSIKQKLDKLQDSLKLYEKKNFKEVAKNITRAINKLSGLEDTLKDELNTLTNQKEELDYTISYMKDLVQDSYELPNSSKEVVTELENQILDLEVLKESTEKSAGIINKVLTDIKSALDKAVSFVKDLLNEFKSKYKKSPLPTLGKSAAELEQQVNSFLNRNQNLLRYKPEFKADIEYLQNFITEVEDMEIKPNEAKIEELAKQLKEITNKLDDLNKEIKVREKIVDKLKEAIQKNEEAEKEAEELAKNVELVKKVFGKPDTIAKTGEPTAEDLKNTYGENNDTQIENIASNSTPSGEPGYGVKTEDHKRAEHFLSQAERFSNRSSLRMIMVTKATEDSLGLTGLVDRVLSNYIPEKRDLANTVVSVYMTEENGKLQYVDKDGKVINEGEQNLDNTVYATMRSGEGEFKGKETYVSKWKNWYKALRTAWLGASVPDSYTFTISAGIQNKYDGKNPVTSNLVSKEDLGTKGLIQISNKDGLVNVGGKSRKYPVGRPVLVVGNSSVFLNNRNITDTEAESLFDAFVNLSKTIKGEHWNPAVTQYIRGVLYFGNPMEGKEVGRNQFWIDENGLLNVGHEGFKTAFTEKRLLENKGKFIAILKASYNNINNNLLQNNARYDEIIGFKEDKPIMRTWKSYQHFLLSDTYDLVESLDEEKLNGKARNIDDIPLTNNLKLYDEESLTGPFKQKYAAIVPKEEEIPQPEKEAKATPNKSTKQTAPTPATATTQTQAETTTPNKSSKTERGRELRRTGAFTDTIYTNKSEVFNIFNRATKRTGESLTQDQIRAIFEDKIVPNFFFDYIADKLNNGTPLTAFEQKFADANKEEVEGFKSGKLVSYSKEIEETPEEIQVEETQSVKPVSTKPAISIVDKVKAAQTQLADEDSDLSDVKDLPFYKPDDNVNTAFRMSTGLDVPRLTQKDWDDFTVWLKKVLPQVSAQRIDHLISILGTDKFAWGVFTKEGIKVYDKAQVGTQYHEAFEAVWNLFLTDKEQIKLWNEFRKRKGEFFDRESNKKVAYSQANFAQAKEAMADYFAEYKESQVMPKGISNKVIKFLRDLYQFLKNWITGVKKEDYQAQALYRAIDTGKFAQAQEVRGFVGEEYSQLPGTTSLQTREIVEAMSANISFTLLGDTEHNGLLYGIEKITANELFEKVKKLTFANISNYMKSESEKAAASTGAEKLIHVRNFNKAKKIGEALYTNWAEAVNITSDFIRSAFHIKIDENAIIIDEKENQTKNEYSRNDFFLDTKGNSSSAIKLLFATLVQTDKTGLKEESNPLVPALELSEFGTPKLVNSSQAFIKVMEKLSNKNTLDNMVEALYKMGQNNPDYVRLLMRIKGSLTNAGALDWNRMNEDDIRLAMDFYVTFAKQAPTPYIMTFNANGDNYLQPADYNSYVNGKIYEWMSNLKFLAKKGNKYITKVKVGKFNGYNIKVTDTTAYAGDSKAIITTRLLPMLELLGVKIDKSTVEKMSDTDATELKSSMEAFLREIKTENITNLTDKNLGIRGRLTEMSQMVIKYTDVEPSAIYFNIENEQQQKFVNDNYYSKFVNSFNLAGSIEELKASFPQFNDIYLGNSQLFKIDGEYFDKDGKKKKGVELSMNYINGLMDEDKPRTIDKITESDRAMITINGILSRENKGYGLYNMIMPGDSATEWMIKLKNLFTVRDFFGDTGEKLVKNIFTGYLKDEMNLIVASRFRGKNFYNTEENNGLRLLKGIFPKALENSILEFTKKNPTPDEVSEFIESKDKKTEKSISDSVGEHMMEFFKEEATSLKELLAKEGKLKYALNDKISISGLDTSFASEYKFTTKSKSEEGTYISTDVSEKELNNLLLAVVTNYAVANTEIVKTVFGDINNFKSLQDMLKRIKSWGSPRKSIYTGEEGNKALHNKYNNKNLNPEDYGYTNFDDKVTSVTIANFIVLGLPSLTGNTYYENVDRSDAQSWAMPTFYREAMLKSGMWSPELEQFFQFDSAKARQYIASIDSEYSKDYNANTKLVKSDLDTIKKGPGKVLVNTIKPIVTGVKADRDYVDIMIDKTSMFPMFFTHLLADSHMQQHFVQNFKNKVDYSIVPTGRKAGVEGMHNFYTPSGKVNTEAYVEDTKLTFSMNNFGIQVETNPHEGESVGVRGTQITKQVTLNLMSGGMPIDFMKDSNEDERFSKWVSIDSEVEKRKISPVYNRIRHNDELLDALTNQGYNTLLDKIGIKDLGDSFSVPNDTKLQKTLFDEISRREANTNVLDSVKLDDKGKFNIAFEASNNYQMIKNMLLSIVDKNVIRPKMTGGSKIQLSSAMFDTDKTLKPYIKTKDGWEEVKDFNALSDKEKSNVRVFSTALKFYHKDKNGKVQPTEILLPHWFKYQLQEAGLNKTDAELLEMLNSEEGRTILKGIGFRIPTQELNSMEVFTIKGFLPQSAGDTVVVPAEITTKAGSDFDVDKLNIYLKNVYVDSKGNLKLIPYNENETENRKELSSIFYDLYDKELSDLESKIVGLGHLQSTLASIGTGEISERGKAKWVSIFKKMFGEDADIIDMEDALMNKLEAAGKRISDLGKADFVDALEKTWVDRAFKQSLQNEYIQSMEGILLDGDNYERLIKPNSNNEMEKLRDELNKITSSDISGNKTKSPLLSLTYINNQRQLSILGKYAVGIAALAQSSHALTQRQPVYIKITPELIKNSKNWGKEYLDDGSIALKHNSVVIDGVGYPTISGITDKNNQYISDKISAYINGFVDIMKDTFIVELGINSNTAGTFIMLERLGVPTDTVVWFMNQPIIREYRKLLTLQGKTNLFNEGNINYILKKFDSKDIVVNNINEKGLKGNIDKYYNKNSEFGDADNAQQQFIFTEFLKYSAMAGDMRSYMQALTWDTANFSDFSLIRSKELLQQGVEQSNVFGSPVKIMQYSSIGNLKSKIGKSTDALSEYLPLQEYKAQKEILRVLDPLIDPTNNFNSTKDIIKLGNKVTASFLDYLVQSKTILNNAALSEKLQSVLINADTDAAHRLKTIKDNTSNPLNKNYAIQQLKYDMGNQVGEANNVTLKLNGKDVFAMNQFINSMRELKDADKRLYNFITMAAILQSGTYKSSISFTDLLPLEDFAAIVNPIVRNLDSIGEFSIFGDKNLFLRNNWGKRDGFIDNINELRLKADGKGVYNQVSIHPFYYKNAISYLENKGITEDSMPIFVSQFNAGSDYITVNRINNSFTPDEISKFKAKGDYFTYKEIVGYEKIKDSEGNPIKIVEAEKDKKTGKLTGKVFVKYVFKPINLYGDGQYAQEYYDDTRKSVFENGTRKVDEVQDNQIFFDAFKSYMDKPIAAKAIESHELNDVIKKLNC